jgi:uncharacterized phage protein (TIGR01671 family)
MGFNKMKQIKFRAWDKDNQGFDYLTLDYDLANLDETLTILTQYQDYFFWNNYFAEEDDKTNNQLLMQFTGLLDKNGKEIYEGDIIIEKEYPFFSDALNKELKPSQYKQLNYVGIVTYDEQHTEYYLCMKRVNNKVAGNVIDYSLSGCSKLEIIGNIYENPELLEQTK